MRVRGHTPAGAAWSESTKCEDASLAGCGFLLGTSVLTGQVLSILLPLPRGLRRYDLAKSTYETYAIVKSTRLAGAIRVGVSFIGKVPPPGYEDAPGARFLIERRKSRRENRYLKIRLTGPDWTPETTVLENIGASGARVMAGRAYSVGDLVTIEEAEGLLHFRGEVRGVYVGKDGIQRLSVRFVD